MRTPSATVHSWGGQGAWAPARSTMGEPAMPRTLRGVAATAPPSGVVAFIRVVRGRDFRLLWAAFAVSTVGTWLAFDAFPLIAVLVLHAGATGVALLAAAGRAVGAVVAVPLGPWVEFRRKRPVMVAMDLTRFAALLTVPAAYAL